MTRIVLRPARPEDRAAVSQLSSQIWDGDDYVADCFDDWLADPNGRFTVACAGEQLAGFGKLTRLAAKEWWLEGLRVDPAWRGKGVARLLHEDVMEAAAEVAKGMLRFATSSKNLAVHRMARDSSFHLVSNHLLVERPVTLGQDREPSSGELIPVIPPELEAVTAWLAQSDHFAGCGGLFERGWQWFEMMPRLPSLIENEQLFWWASGKNTACSGLLAIDRPVAAGILRFLYLEIPQDEWAPLAAELLGLASQFQARLIKGKPLATQATHGLSLLLKDNGWVVEDGAMSVFERQLENG